MKLLLAVDHENRPHTSLPARGRGLKLLLPQGDVAQGAESLPARGRGLKRRLGDGRSGRRGGLASRFPRGGVD